MISLYRFSGSFDVLPPFGWRKPAPGFFLFPAHKPCRIDASSRAPLTLVFFLGEKRVDLGGGLADYVAGYGKAGPDPAEGGLAGLSDPHAYLPFR